MTFSTFNLFGSSTRSFTDPSKLFDVAKDVAANYVGDLIPGDNILGLIPGVSLSGLKRRKFGGYGFVVDTVTNEKLAFQYNVRATETGGADFAEHITLGRSTPVIHYKGGKTRILQIPVEFTIQKNTREDVLQSIRWLQALAYPDYQNEDEVVLGPHPVVVVQGKLYTDDVWVVRDFSVQWGQALDPVTQLPESATANISLIEYKLTAKSREEFLVV